LQAEQVAVVEPWDLRITVLVVAAVRVDLELATLQ
jgi:hypothetical protein